MVLHCRHDQFGRIPAVEFFLALRTVRMNGDGDLVFLDELVQAVEAIGVGIGAEGLDAERFTKLEDFLAGVVILGEGMHAEGDRLDGVFAAQFGSVPACSRAVRAWSKTRCV